MRRTASLAINGIHSASGMPYIRSMEGDPTDPDESADTLSIALGRRIVALRGEEKAVDLARRIDMSPSYLSRVETAQTVVSVRNAARIAVGLGVTLSELFEDIPAEAVGLGSRTYRAVRTPGRPRKA